MRTRIKICGITRLEDAESACDAGVDALGFVFWPASPRAIEVEAARAIVRTLPPCVTAVGVFVDAAPDDVNGIVSQVGLQAAQLHGHEPFSSWTRICVPVTKSVAVSGATTAGVFDGWPAGVLPLLDAADPDRRGGTGMTVDWTVAASLAASRRLVLAGGLRPGNVEEAVRTVRPWAVDVSSGVERARGIKDRDLIRQFVAAVARADARGE